MIGLKLSHVVQGAILDWTGPTNGSQNMEDNPILYFLTAGTYTLTVRRSFSLTWEICGNGAHGGPGAADANGGHGGGCGEVRNATFTLVPGQSYTLILQGANIAANSYVALGGTVFVAAGGANNRNAPIPSNIGTVVYPGRAGGTGGSYATVDADGAPGGWSGGYSPGAGGGGSTAGSQFCNKGGDGGGNPGSGNDPARPGGFVPCMGGAGGPGVGWRVFAIGRGGGGGASGNPGQPGGGNPGGQTPGFPAGAVTTFVGLA